MAATLISGKYASRRSFSLTIITRRIGATIFCTLQPKPRTFCQSFFQRLTAFPTNSFVTLHMPDASNSTNSHHEIALLQVRAFCMITVLLAVSSQLSAPERCLWRLKDRRSVWGHVPFPPFVSSSSCYNRGPCTCQHSPGTQRTPAASRCTQPPRTSVHRNMEKYLAWNPFDTRRRFFCVQASREAQLLLLLFFSNDALARFAAAA